MSRSSSAVQILKAQSEGYSAYLNGLSIPDCPYTEPELHSAWVRGYAASRTDRAHANRDSTSEAHDE